MEDSICLRSLLWRTLNCLKYVKCSVHDRKLQHFQMVSLEVNLFLVPFNIYKTSYKLASDNSPAGVLFIRAPQCFLDVTTYFNSVLCIRHMC